jgi:hypothetical protein
VYSHRPMCEAFRLTGKESAHWEMELGHNDGLDEWFGPFSLIFYLTFESIVGIAVSCQEQVGGDLLPRQVFANRGTDSSHQRLVRR